MVLGTFIIPRVVKAQSIISDHVCNFSSGQISMACIPNFIAYIIQVLFGFLGAVFFIMLLWGAYEYAFSGVLGTGEEGKKRIKNAIFGLMISICCFAILDFILTDVTGAT
jgi:hypothetical protein